jgi:hypothetical protein
MTHLPPKDRQALIAYVVGLAVACPINQDNPVDCPLHELRSQSFQDRLKWVKALDDESLYLLAQHHCSCLAAKEGRL